MAPATSTAALAGTGLIPLVSEAIQGRKPAQTVELVTGTWADSVKPAKPEACFPIRTVTVRGIELVPAKEISDAIRPYAGPCQGNTLVKGLMLAINGVYAKHGYVTTQAYLPKQDLKTTRRLEVEVKIGRIGEIRYNEKPSWEEGTYFDRLSNRFRAIFSANDLQGFFTALDRFADTIDDPLERPLLATPAARLVPATVIKAGEPLELESMQHGLDTLNKVPSSRAQAKLEPGNDPATSVVVINNAPEDTFRVIAGYDTYGTRATGIQRARLEVARDNLLGINDGWKASLTSAQNSNELTAGIALPFQWFTLTADLQYSEILTPVSSFAELFSQNGSVTIAGITTLERTPAERLDLVLGVRFSGNNRFVDDVALTPQRFLSVEAGLTKSWTLGKTGLFTLGVTYWHGLDAWLASPDPPHPSSTTPLSQFQKVQVNATLNWAPINGVTLSSNLQTQWSDSPLYYSDQLTLGTLSSIRGFQTQPFAADRGAIWRNELASRLPVDWALEQLRTKGDTWINNRLKGFEGYLFLDAGYGQDLANRTDDLMIGAGAGLRYRDSRITADWSFAHGVYEMSKAAPKATEMYLNIDVKLF